MWFFFFFLLYWLKSIYLQKDVLLICRMILFRFIKLVWIHKFVNIHQYFLCGFFGCNFYVWPFHPFIIYFNEIEWSIIKMDFLNCSSILSAIHLNDPSLSPDSTGFIYHVLDDRILLHDSYSACTSIFHPLII